MRVPVSWLREFVALPQDTAEIAERLGAARISGRGDRAPSADHRRRGRAYRGARETSQRRPFAGWDDRRRRGEAVDGRNRRDERSERTDHRRRDDRCETSGADDCPAHDARRRIRGHDDLGRRACASRRVVRRRHHAARSRDAAWSGRGNALRARYRRARRRGDDESSRCNVGDRARARTGRRLRRAAAAAEPYQSGQLRRAGNRNGRDRARVERLPALRRAAHRWTARCARRPHGCASA